MLFRYQVQIRQKNYYFKSKKLKCVWDIKRYVLIKFHEKKFFFIKDKNKKPKMWFFTFLTLNFEVKEKKCKYKSCRSFYYLHFSNLTFFDRTCSFLGNRDNPIFTLKNSPSTTSQPQIASNLFFLHS